MFPSQLTKLLPLAILLSMTEITQSQLNEVFGKIAESELTRTRFPNVPQRLFKSIGRWDRNERKKFWIEPIAARLLTNNERKETPPGEAPQGRRFLFSPTIQNTITNLNHNSNLQEAKDTTADDENANPRTGTLQYDIRTRRPKKICFTFE